jgi:hypothetical protein
MVTLMKMKRIRQNESDNDEVSDDGDLEDIDDL